MGRQGTQMSTIDITIQSTPKSREEALELIMLMGYTKEEAEFFLSEQKPK